MILPPSLAEKRVRIRYSARKPADAISPPPSHRDSPRDGTFPKFNNPPGASAQLVDLSRFRACAQYQILSLWCWNAVGAALVEYHLDAAGAGHTLQCATACSILGRNDCCMLNVPDHGPIGNLRPYMQFREGMPSTSRPIHYKPPREYSCNKAYHTEVVTKRAGLKSCWMKSKLATGPDDQQLLQIINALMRGNPVVMLLNFSGYKHALTIFGTKEIGNIRWFLLADPWDGIGWFDHIHESGVWTWSMFTTREARPVFM